MKSLLKKNPNKAYNPEIDIWKFLFAIPIFIFHTKKFLPFTVLPNGFLAVEFFFFVSGYFAAEKIRSDDKKGIPTPTDRFLLNKLKGFYKVYFAAFLISFILYQVTVSGTEHSLINDIFKSLFEVLLVRFYSLKTGVCYNGPTWYIACMMTALAVLYPLAKKYKSQFFRVACPLIACSLYGLMLYKCRTLNATNTIAFLSVSYAVIRAFAGICVGMTINEACAMLKERETPLRPSLAGKIVFLICEIVLVILIFIFMVYGYGKDYSKSNIFIAIPFLALFVFLVFSELTGIKELLNGINLSWLSSISLYLYLNHRIMTVFIPYIFPFATDDEKYILYIVLTITAMIVCRFLVFLFDLYFKKLSPLLKKALFKSYSKAGKHSS